MLVSYSRLLNMPILSLQTGGPLGKVTEAIIDPRQFHILAFYCTGPRIRGTAILHTADIREVSSIGLIVDNADTLMSPDEDLVRLKEVRDINFTLLGKAVVDTHKQRLGKVEGYSVDMNSFYIMKINVQRPLLKSFTGSNLLIDRTQITGVNDRQIIVQAPDVQAREAAKKAVPLIENPFKRSHAPQPDGTSTKVAAD